MSRYGDNRYSQGNLAYREPPPTRWDADRFARERDYRQSPQDDYYAQSPRRPSRAAPVYEEERYYEDDRYGPRGSRQERRYFEEDEYYDPRANRGQMVPFRPEPPRRPAAPPRPGQLLRRQSSLDTFDRPPQRRYEDFDTPARRRPERVNIPVPEPPSPRGNRYRPSQPARPPRREYYEDVSVQDPDYYGDDGFREYREREWISSRRKEGSRSPSRSPSRSRTEAAEERKSEVFEKKEEKEEVTFEKKVSKEEKPFPRRGKTKMPKRLVHTKVLFDLGYPFYEENEKTIIIEKALGPDNIDEVFVKSKEYREKEVSTTRLIEAPPPRSSATTIIVPAPSVKSPTIREPSPQREEFREEIREEIRTVPISEAPRSVREWDNLAPESAPRRSQSRATRRSPSPGEVRETIIERRKSVVERSPSPARTSRTHRTSRSRRRGSFDETEIIERRIVREDDGFDESNSVHVGPLALVVDRSQPRSDREIKEEIAKLQRERRASRREREFERDDEIVRIERRRSRAPSPVGEVIIERRGDEVVEVRRDKRERSKSRVRPPSANLIKNMMYTLT